MSPVDYGFADDVRSRSFRLHVNGHPVRVAEIPPLDEAERQRLAAAYRQLPSYCHIYDPACMHLHYAHLAVAGTAECLVEIDAPLTSVRVHPLRLGVRVEIEGSRLRFTVDPARPRYLILRLDALPPLVLIFDAPAAAPVDPAKILDAGAFLTDCSGRSDQTAPFQRAFAAVNGTGKTLLVPPGVYSVTQLHFKDGRDCGIHFAAGCLLKIAPSLHGENEHRHGLWLEDCADVTLTGPGGIDHQAYEHYVRGGNDYQHGMVDYYTSTGLCPWITQSPLFITGSRRITVDGLLIRNGRNFNVNCRNCDDLVLRGIKILTPPACTPEYADGINTGSCHRVLVEDCLVAANDDCFASGHYFARYDRRPSAQHVIRGMVGWNMRASAARLGFFADHDQGDFLFECCDFSAHIYTTLLIHALRPTAAGVPARYGTICLRDCAFDDAPRLDAMLVVEKAAIDRLVCENITFFGPPRAGAQWLIESDPAHPIRSLELKSITIDGQLMIPPAPLHRM